MRPCPRCRARTLGTCQAPARGRRRQSAATAARADPASLPPQAELRAARVDLASRDHCAHLLIPLNECRRKALYMPWACKETRHAYEKCLYFDYKRRVAKQGAAREEGV